MNLFEYIEDWDNTELSEDEWQQQMEEAVKLYNQEYNTEHKPSTTVWRYKRWQRDQNQPEE